jgi:hypothetical protein
LIISPSDPEARSSRKNSPAWTGYHVQVTETGEADAPQLMGQVISTSATMADGIVVEAVHAHREEQLLLPAPPWVALGLVDARHVLGPTRSWAW